MAHSCQLTEITQKEFPELFQFYQYSPSKYPYLLTTTSQPTSASQSDSSTYDILFIQPEDWLRLSYSQQISASRANLLESGDNEFLKAFDTWYQSEKITQPTLNINEFVDELPFRGGWFLFLAYELSQQIEPCLNLPNEKQVLPTAFAARVKKALIYDHKNNKLFFISENSIDHKEAYQSLLQDSNEILNSNPVNSESIDHLVHQLAEEDDSVFLESVAKVKHYIKEGDVFQVNLSRLWRSEIINPEVTDPEAKSSKAKSIETNYHYKLVASLYKRLSIANPAPFSGVASFESEYGVASIVSSSPERLLKAQAMMLESRPIAGTHPRSPSIDEDRRLMSELHQHPKEQAEHIMLIDLIRNDLGRVCQPGTVKVNELMVNESYAHVHHIVSNVVGRMRDNCSPADAIRAMFPGGTITGCPKVRCMEIIAELEKKSRGAYTGSMGYINLDGNMDLNILIRTMVLEQYQFNNRTKQRLSFRAGAGLVYDSIADRELNETRAKAKGLLTALQACLS